MNMPMNVAVAVPGVVAASLLGARGVDRCDAPLFAMPVAVAVCLVFVAVVVIAHGGEFPSAADRKACASRDISRRTLPCDHVTVNVGW